MMNSSADPGSRSVQTDVELESSIQKIFLTAEEIDQRITEMGREISQDYNGLNPVLVGVLKGVLCFMADLLRKIMVPLEVDFMAVSNYSPESRDQGFVRLVKDLEIPILDRHVLFIEDVIDTGLTLNYLLQNLQARKPASLKVCTLFNKPSHRLIDLPVQYTGFDIPGQFVVGYGLDFREQYRNLPYVGLLKPEAFQ